MRARALAFAAIAALCAAAGFAPHVFAQQADEPLVATANEWGGQGGVYTCAQWRAYVTRMYRLGDSRHRGYIEAKDFEIIKKASPVFQMATFDYFDMTGKGRVTQKEFIEFESPFFARFDRRHTCRVTSEDIRAANTPTQAQTQTPQQRGAAEAAAWPAAAAAWAAASAGGRERRGSRILQHFHLSYMPPWSANPPATHWSRHVGFERLAPIRERAAVRDHSRRSSWI